LTDETFSILCHEEVPEGYDKSKVYFWISALDQLYWVVGSVLGTIAGSFITFDTTGLDFALTALFVSIFTDQWRQKEGHLPALIGIVASVGCLLIFGQSSFIVPAMIVILVVLGARYQWKEKCHD
jgi:4-azaleucine resistance transporter AzlC